MVEAAILFKLLHTFILDTYKVLEHIDRLSIDFSLEVQEVNTT